MFEWEFSVYQIDFEGCLKILNKDNNNPDNSAIFVARKRKA